MFDYAYFNSLIILKEQKIVSENELLPLLKTSSLYASLKDLGYGDNQKTVAAMLESEAEKLNAFILEKLPDNGLIDILNTDYEATRLKTIFKNVLFKTTVPIIYESEEEKIRDFLETKDIKKLPRKLVPFFKHFDFDKLDQFNVNTKVDQIVFKIALKKTLRYPFLRKWFREKIDLTNLLTNRRIEKLGLLDYPKEDLFIAGGNLTRKTKKVPVKYEEIFASDNLSEVEKQIDEYLISYFHKMSVNPLGYEKFCEYFLKKKQEEKMIKILLLEENNG